MFALFEKGYEFFKKKIEEAETFLGKKYSEYSGNNLQQNTENANEIIAVDSKIKDSNLLIAAKVMAGLGMPLLGVGVVLGIISFFIPVLAVPAFALVISGACVTATAMLAQRAYHDRLIEQVYGPSNKEVYKQSVTQKDNASDRDKKLLSMGLEPRNEKEKLISNRPYGNKSLNHENKKSTKSLNTDFVIDRQRNKEINRAEY